MNIIGKRAERGGGRVAVKLVKYVFDCTIETTENTVTFDRITCYTLRTAAPLKVPKTDRKVISYKLLSRTDIYAYMSIDDFITNANMEEI